MEKYYVIVEFDGDTYWYSNPECRILHRVGGPAVEFADGSKSYWINGQRHRIDGPAIEYNTGYKAYYQNGKRHRLDGPARIGPEGEEDYWIEGVQYTKEDFLRKTAPVKELTVVDVEKLLGYQVKIVKE